MKAHAILSKTLVPFFYRGRNRDAPIVVIEYRINSIVYTAIKWQLVEEKMNALTARLAKQFARGDELQERIRENLKGIGYDF